MQVNYAINNFMKNNRNNFPKTFDMNTLTQEELAKVYNVEFKSPIAAWWLQLLLGGLGAGRFYIGDWKVGLGQLILSLCAGLGMIWAFADLFMIRSRTRELNMSKLEMVVNGSSKVPTFGVNLNVHNQ